MTLESTNELVSTNELISRIRKLPNIIEDKIFLYTSHPIVEGFDMNKRREFRFAVLDKKQFYKYIHDKVDFFTEDETWERTNEVFNPTMCNMLRKMYYNDKPRRRIHDYWRKKQVKQNIIKQNNLVKEHINKIKQSTHNADNINKMKNKRWQLVKKDGDLIVKTSSQGVDEKNIKLKWEWLQ